MYSRKLETAPGGSVAKNLPAIAGDAGDGGSILDQGDPLEKGLASYCLGNPWTEEPGGLLSIGSRT